MAQPVVGLDFGTTNSLVAYVDAYSESVRVLKGHDGRPHPSTVWYNAGQTVVGREARSQLEGDSATFGFIRSPKRLLGREAPVNVDGTQMSASDIIADVLAYLRNDAFELREGHRVTVERAVLTIPVDLDGAGRRQLREAAQKAGIRIVQFVHEPLAALYAWLRAQPDHVRLAAELEGRRVLVVDWGGGTLDLTLCVVRDRRLVQVANAGDNEVGGDYFDELIRNGVRERHAREHNVENLLAEESPEGRKRLLARCETAKIALSNRETAQVTLRNYLRAEKGRHLNLTLTRSELVEWTRPKVTQGLQLIDRLLEEHGLVPQDVEVCLPTGGMVNVPAVRDGLIQRFGVRAVTLVNGDSIIAEGAAWIAHDALRLSLAKPIELEQPDGSFLALVPEGHRLPVENEVARIPGSQFFCVDPRDGVARFHFARPTKLGYGSRSAPRKSYATLALMVDPIRQPFIERLHVDLSIDHDYVVRVSARSSGYGDMQSVEIHDLEFAVDLPGSRRTGKTGEEDDIHSAVERSHHGVSVKLRSNVTNRREEWSMVPGDVVEQWRPTWFDTRSDQCSPQQRAERDYYRPCAICKRTTCDIEMRGCLTCTIAPWAHSQTAAGEILDIVSAASNAKSSRAVAGRMQV